MVRLKTIEYFFYGVLIGVAVAVVMYVLGFVVELFNCSCAVVTFNCNPQDALPFMWSLDAFKKCIMFTTIGGGIIGGIYGAVIDILESNERMKEESRENNESVVAHRRSNAEKIKKIGWKALASAYAKQKKANDYVLQTTYVGNTIQREGWEALKSAYETNAELQSIIEEISKQEVNK